MALCRAHASAWPHVVGRENEEPFLISREVNIVLTVKLHTCHGIGAVLTHLQVVGSHGVPHPFRPMLLLRFNGVGALSHVALGNGIGEETLHFLTVIQAERGAQVEVLEGV